jgi:hypothetical protein
MKAPIELRNNFYLDYLSELRHENTNENEDDFAVHDYYLPIESFSLIVAFV